jgi:hypothetical protein
MHPMLYNISNLLMIDSLPFSKHALKSASIERLEKMFRDLCQIKVVEDGLIFFI